VRRRREVRSERWVLGGMVWVHLGNRAVTRRK
jgi:hypothetical protein